MKFFKLAYLFSWTFPTLWASQYLTILSKFKNYRKNYRIISIVHNFNNHKLENFRNSKKNFLIFFVTIKKQFSSYLSFISISYLSSYSYYDNCRIWKVTALGEVFISLLLFVFPKASKKIFNTESKKIPK